MDGAMTTRATPRLAVGATASLVAAALLAGCSGQEPTAGVATASSSPSASTATATASASESAYLPVPSGTELTDPGSELDVGDTAVVAWEPRQGTVGAISVRIDRLERTTFEESFRGWKIEGPTLQTRPYFVRATIENVGDTGLGGFRVPLYIVDGENTLVEYSGFGSTFEPCPSTDFPETFAPGDRQQVCLVYLAPDQGELSAVSFRPTQEFNPITWTGDLQAVRPAGKGRDGDARGSD